MNDILRLGKKPDSKNSSYKSKQSSNSAAAPVHHENREIEENHREATNPRPTEISTTNENKGLLDNEMKPTGIDALAANNKKIKKINADPLKIYNDRPNTMNTGKSQSGQTEMVEYKKDPLKNESMKSVEQVNNLPASKKILVCQSSLYSKKDSSKNSEDEKENEEEDNNEGDGDENEDDDRGSNMSDDMRNDDLFNRERRKDRQLVKMEKICDSETEDEGTDDDEKYAAYVISADNAYKKLWDIFIAILLIYSAIVLPFKLAFVDVDTYDQKLWDTITDGIFFVDLILSFFSAYYDSDENLIKNRKKITMNYLKSWFIIDLCSCIPLSFVEFQSEVKDFTGILRVSKISKLYRLVKLTKLFRMVKIAKKGNVNKITKYFLEKFKVNANVERLVYFVMIFLILNHLSACIWYWMAVLQDKDPECWVIRLGFADLDVMELYINSFYWTLTTVTTVGYGDINAGTTLERIFNLVIMSFGVLMYSFAIGSLSSIVSTLDAKTAEMNQKLQILSSIKNEFKLDADIYDKVRKVIKYDLSRNQKDKMNFLQELPNKLRIELSKIMHDNVIQKLYFFRGQAQDFIAYVAPLLKPVKFCQNDYLYKTGDMIDESKFYLKSVYFIGKGTISFCLSKDFDEKEIKEIKKNNNFGEIEMCLNEQLTFDIKIKSRNCELFVLKKNDFLRLSVNYKEAIEKFLQRSLLIYLRFNEDKKKAKKSVENANMEGNYNEKEVQNINKQDSLVEIREENDEDNEDEDEEEKNSKKDYSFEKKIQEQNEEVRAKEKKPTNKTKGGKNSSESDSEDDEGARKGLNGPLKGIEEVNKETTNLVSKEDKRPNHISSKKLDPEKIKTTLNNKQKVQSTKDVKDIEKNFKDQKNVERLKGEINKKFLKKLDKLMEFLSKTKIQFDNTETNPMLLLEKLKQVIDITERNEIIDQIESIVTNLFKVEKKKI